MDNQNDFEPRILGFCCNWCSYAGADLAGVSRMQYRPNVRVIRVMCSGRIDPAFVIEGFLRRMDGVMVLGCHLGDCHYSTGNYEAINMINEARKLLEYSGINSGRLLLDWVSASEGARFSEVVTNFTEEIRGLGPLGAAEGRDFSELEFKLRAAQATARGEKLRWVAAKQTEFMTEGNKYGEVFSRHELNRMLEGVIADEMAVNEILLLMKERPLSVKEMAAAIDLPPPRVLRYVSALRKKGLVDLHSLDGNSPQYAIRVEEEVQQ